MSFSFKSHAQTGVEVFGHNATKDGNPAGGYAASWHPARDNEAARRMGAILNDTSDPCHLSIRWQDGPVDREAGETPNGAFVEDILEVCKRRLEFCQDSPLACHENEVAIGDIQHALESLLARRKDRADRGVEGKYEA